MAIDVGDRMPAFTLEDEAGNAVSRGDFAGSRLMVGVSPDPPSSNARFKKKEGLNFPLLSDEGHRLASDLGAWGAKKNYGKEYEGLIRSTFVVGPDGILEAAYRNVRATGHVTRLVGELLGAD